MTIDLGAMNQKTSTRPTYAAAFQCIGPQCEDICCKDWEIPVDRQTFEKYQQFSADKLGKIVSDFVTITPTAPDPLHAHIHLTSAGNCAFLRPDSLCSIQNEYGPALLSSTCSIYPRALNHVAGRLEGSLHLSCPEAARNVLFNPDAMQITGDMQAGAFRTDSVAHLSFNQDGHLFKPYSHFLAIRELLLSILRNRTRSIEQRILLIGAVCERLHFIQSQAQQDHIPQLLAEYHDILDKHRLIAELDALPTAHELQLDVVLKLMAHRIRKGADEPRFAETSSQFLQGIGFFEESGANDRTRRYLDAYRDHYQPFFTARPHSLENYLINYTYQTLFPFGRAGSPHYHQQGILDEYILLATHFAWLRALLIGVAGYQRNEFAEEHVVQTVQSFCRAIEHQPNFLFWMNQAMREFRLDTPSGMAILLRL